MFRIERLLIATLLVSLLLKLMHWPGGTSMSYFSLIGFAIIYLPMGVWIEKAVKNESSLDTLDSLLQDHSIHELVPKWITVSSGVLLSALSLTILLLEEITSNYSLIIYLLVLSLVMIILLTIIGKGKESNVYRALIVRIIAMATLGVLVMFRLI